MAKVLADFDTAHSGAIHDAQLDPFRQCLATASADGFVRLWDVRDPAAPTYLASLSGHTGAVRQVAWAPAACGVLLASSSADGTVRIWGRGAASPADWVMLRVDNLQQHGEVGAVAWAPSEHGPVLACCSEDGSVTVLRHVGAGVSSNEDEIEHQWQPTRFKAHSRRATAVSWATAPHFSTKVVGLKGAQFATAGEDGVQVWYFNEGTDSWQPQAVDQRMPAEDDEETVEFEERPAPAPRDSVCLPLLEPTADTPDEAEASAAAPRRHVVAGGAAGARLARDVAWRPYTGFGEMLAEATGDGVVIWEQDDRSPKGRWRPRQRICVGEEVWRVSWAPAGGNVLVASFGIKDQRAALLKQRLDGTWDVMDIQAEESIEQRSGDMRFQ